MLLSSGISCRAALRSYSSRHLELSTLADWFSANLQKLQPLDRAEVEHRPFASHALRRSTVWREALSAETLPPLITEARAVEVSLHPSPFLSCVAQALQG